MAIPKPAIALATAFVALVATLAIWRPWQGTPNGGSAVGPATFDAGPGRAPPKPPTLAKPGDGSQRLRGWIRGADNSPVLGASVTAVMELGPGVRGTAPANASAVVAVSAADGSFTLEGLREGRHHLRIEGQGIVTAELRFVEAPGDGLVVVVSREVSIAGRVDGQTISGVRVFLRSESQVSARDVDIDEGGRFSAEGLAEGRYQVWAQGPQSASRPQWVARLGTGPFEEIVIALEPAFEVRGRVVEEGSGEMGLRATVRVQSALGDIPPHLATSNEDGTFVVPGVLSGPWIVSAEAPGYGASSRQEIQPEEGRSVLLALASGVAVKGTVRSSLGGVLEGAQVELIGEGKAGEVLRYGGAPAAVASPLAEGQRFIERGELGVLLGPIPLVPPPGAFATRIAQTVPAPEEAGESAAVEAVPLGRASAFVTDGVGAFAIYGAAPGTYRLVVRHPDFATATSRPFVLRSRMDMLTRVVTLRAGTKLTGSVLTSDGVPIPGASIYAKRSEEGENPVLAVSAEDGGFALAPMTGRIELIGEAVGYGRFRQVMRLAPGGMTAVAKHVEMRLPKADQVLVARLVDPAGFPLRGATVTVKERPDSMPRRPATSDAEGLIRIDGLLPGPHTFAIVHGEFPPHETTLAPAEDLEIAVPFGAAAKVLVRDADSDVALPLARVSVTVGATTVHAVADKDGVANLAVLPVGRADVTASLEGYATAKARAQLSAKTQRTGPVHDIPLQLARGCTLAGFATDEDGERLVGATIRAEEVSAKTDREGRFRLENVRSGDVELEISKGGKVGTESLSLESGEERLTLELRVRFENSSNEEDEGAEVDAEVEENASLDEEDE